MEIEAIAYFNSPFGTKFGVPRQSGLAGNLAGEVRFCSGFRREEYLRGLEGFDYIWLIWGFSENVGKGKPTVRPPRLGGNRTMGVFATRSSFRPNSLALSSVRLTGVDFKNGILNVLGADLMDGTPIYDVKPYIPYTDSHPDARDGFVGENGWNKLKIKDAGRYPADLVEVLSLDPRPQYQDDPEKVYGMMFKGKDIHFKVIDNTLTILDEDII